MSRRFLVLNIILGIASVAFAAGIVRLVIVKRPLPPPAASRAATPPPPTAAVTSADPGLSSYAVIASRNLFNPARSETTVAVSPVSKPILHGVVIDGAKSRAFLEDPAVKRVAGYSVGDMIGGGRIQKISDDKVVIARPEGLLEVLLQDPSKPRATPVSATPVVTGSQGAAPPQAPSAPQAPTVQQAPTIGPPPPAPTSPPLRRRERPSSDD